MFSYRTTGAKKKQTVMLSDNEAGDPGCFWRTSGDNAANIGMTRPEYDAFCNRISYTVECTLKV